MRQTRLLVAIGVIVWLAVVAGSQTPSGALGEPLRGHMKAEPLGLVTSVRGMPLGVREALQTLFNSRNILDIAEPDGPFRAGNAATDVTLPLRRMVAAGCSTDHCLVYYVRGGFEQTWHVALFHWTPAETRLEWGGTARAGLKNIDEVRSAMLAGTIGGPAEFW